MLRRHLPVRLTRSVRAMVFALSVAQGASAQTGPRIPVRQVAVEARSDSTTLGYVRDVRAVGADRVFVNDIDRHQVLKFDADLAKSTAIFSNDGAAKYGRLPSKLMSYLGDSSVFVDLEAGALVVLDANAITVRSMAPPTSLAAMMLLRYSGSIAFDLRGALVYQADRATLVWRGERGAGPATSAPPVGTVYQRDSSLVLRASFETRSADTVAAVPLPVRKVVTTVRDDGRRVSETALNPVAELDDWTLLPDGTVAVLRAHDYHIDWVGNDTRVRSTAKMPIDWRPLSVKDKQDMIDSVRREIAEYMAANPPPVRPGAPPPAPLLFVEPNDIPDYFPAIRTGQVKSAPSGNVWIAPNTSLITGGPVWDVINRDGVIIERVQLPAGRRLLGFGPGGTIYAACKTATGERLERLRVIR